MPSLRRPPAAVAVALALGVLVLSAPAHVMGASVSTTSTSGTTTYAPREAAPAPGSAPSAGATTAPPAAGTATPGASTPAPSGAPLAQGARRSTKARDGGTHISALAIVLAALGAALVLACAAWALARRRALEPHWWLSLRHAVAEAEYRASSTWAELTDWARLGH